MRTICRDKREEDERLRLAEELTGLSNPFPHGFPGRQKEFDLDKLSYDLLFYTTLIHIAEGIQSLLSELPQCSYFPAHIIYSRIRQIDNDIEETLIERLLCYSTACIERTEDDQLIVIELHGSRAGQRKLRAHQ
ncbi:MAG TPA: hypothetical protein VEH76_01775 [Methylocystis sp.]|nr:hypothetical protein [Methylocystis sp.]